MAIKSNAVEAMEAGKAEGLKPLYLEAVSRVERLHRRLLDLIKDEFDRMGWDDINPVQALLMFNIGDAEMTARVACRAGIRVWRGSAKRARGCL